ncbi:SCO7613 C-terminal domain-containing membrane protein [Streptomyces sp. NPDC054796]
MERNHPPVSCPGCQWPVPAPEQVTTVCPRCGLPLVGSVPGRLREIDGELWALDARRGTLLSLRHQLLAELRAGTAPPPVPPAGGGPAHPTGAAWAPPPSEAPRAPGGAAPPTAQNVLLTLGGVLLAVAALAFTLVSWGSMGIGGRAAVLAVVTAGTLAVPALLLRRALRSTAECVAALGMLLLVLDAYALYSVALTGADGWAYAATACAVIAVVGAGYGLLLPRPGLRLPVPGALCLAQLAPLLGAVAADAGPWGFAWTLLATAGGDVALAVVCGRSARVGGRVPGLVTTAAVAAGVAACPALALGLGLSVAAVDAASAARAGAVLAALTVLALYAARAARLAGHGTLGGALSVAGGLTLLAGAGGVVRVAVPSPQWWVPGYLLCAVLLLAVASVLAAPGSGARSGQVPWLRPHADGLRLAALCVHGCALLWTVPALLQAVWGPLSWAGRVWEGAPHGVRDALTPGTDWVGGPGVPVVLGATTAVLALAPRLLPAPWTATGTVAKAPTGTRETDRAGNPARADTNPHRTGEHPRPTDTNLHRTGGNPLRTGEHPLRAGAEAASPGPAWAPRAVAAAVVTGAAAVVVLPSALGLPYVVAVGVSLLLVLALLAAAVVVRTHPAGPTALGAALAVAAGTTGLALAERAVTLVALAVLAAAFALAAPLGAPGPRRAVAACASALAAAGLAVAASAVLGAEAHQAAFALLGVGFLTLGSATALRRDAAVAVPLEATGVAVAVGGLALAGGRLAAFSLALALCGVAAAAVALRADRRPWAGYASGALLLCATWTRLYASEITTPEAYTLPVSALLLPLGLLRRRRDDGVSSWAAYGPGLAASLLPSLVAAWGDPDWPRPLLLGTVSLGLTLAGARLRMLAPLLLGGAVLGLVGVHELAPYLAQVVGALPRWVAPALAGALLLAVGATYEQRLRDAQRLRTALSRMR